MTTLRLLVDGWQDGIVDLRPGTADGAALRSQVRAAGYLLDALVRPLPLAGDELSRRRPAG